MALKDFDAVLIERLGLDRTSRFTETSLEDIEWVVG